MSEEEEYCELSVTYRSWRKIKMALLDQRSKRAKACSIKGEVKKNISPSTGSREQ
jgi:hypothetical protein